jgi:nitrogenase iron protein
MAEIAIYGKGGIGKSTIAANVSAALAQRGKRVLQIGCDPKHDSTRLLLHGERLTTVLDYIKRTSPDRCRLSDIVRTGVFGVDCLEAGGPEPGVGCAGRGILTTFELIGRLGIKNRHYDATVYDVLGDVVCGGFAVPIRREYAEKIYIVTSGEFMALYAANNILRGLKNYDQNREGRAGGLIFNSRALGDSAAGAVEDERVRRFCASVGLPLAASFPRSDLFSHCEAKGTCLVEAYPGSELAGQFFGLAEFMVNQKELYPANPLSDEELEERILGRARGSVSVPAFPQTAPQEAEAPAPGIFSKSLVAREPLMGCAFSGAMSITTQIADSVSVAHGPRSCAHIAYQSITSTPRRFLLERGIVLPYTSAPPLVSSDMNEGVMIFGGIEELRGKIRSLKAQGGSRVFFVLTTCPAGIIGDNVSQVLDLEDDSTKIVPIRTDGNIQGDYLQGILFAYFETARALIDRNVEAEEDTVNIVAEKAETYALYDSFAAVKEILDHFGLRVNCHFIRETSPEDIRNFKRGKLNLLAWGDYMGRAIREFLEKEYGAEFFDEPFPIGFAASSLWARRLGEKFHRSDERIEAMLADYRERYRAEIERIRPKLLGKRVMIITITQNIDWVLQTALDAGMELAFVGILSFSQDDLFTTELGNSIGELVLGYNAEKRNADIARVKPDLLLSPYPSAEDLGPVYQDTITYSPEAGFFSGLVLARRWAEIFNMNLSEGWKKDEGLFRKYYA